VSARSAPARVAGGFDEFGEHAESGLTPAGFVEADHGLRDSGAAGEVSLGEPGTASSVAEYRCGAHLHGASQSRIVYDELRLAKRAHGVDVPV
jgi:hypothetical protein